MQPGRFDIEVPGKVKKEVFEIVETYLNPTKGNSEVFVRKIGKNDSYVYNHEVRLYQNNERILKKRQISAREYIEYLNQKASHMRELKKFR